MKSLPCLLLSECMDQPIAMRLTVNVVENTDSFLVLDTSGQKAEEEEFHQYPATIWLQVDEFSACTPVVVCFTAFPPTRASPRPSTEGTEEHDNDDMETDTGRRDALANPMIIIPAALPPTGGQ